jgi:hypothetical protein
MVIVLLQRLIATSDCSKIVLCNVCVRRLLASRRRTVFLILYYVFQPKERNRSTRTYYLVDFELIHFQQFEI